MLRLIILGCGTPAPSLTRWGTAFLLGIGDDWLLFDCGPATTYKMFRAGVKVTEVDHVFFTHHHSDHDSDYPCFLLTRFDMHTGKENPLNVYGPPPTERLTDQLMGEDRGAFWHDVVARTNHPMSLGAYRGRGGTGERKPPVIHAGDLASGDVVKGNGWQVRAAEVAHAQPYLDSLGYRVDTDEGSVAFSGDTRPCKALTELARSVDLLVMECTRREPDMSEGSRMAETGSRGAAQTAVDSGAKKMVLVHQNEMIDEPVARTEVIAEVKGIYGGPVIWGEELLEIEI